MSDTDDLARKNRELTAQVKLLIRTEQRLNRAQRSMEAQLRRIEDLNDFALGASATSDEDAILERALRLLLDLFPYDQAVAFLTAGEGPPRAVRAAAVEGRLASAAQAVAAKPEAGVDVAAIPARPTTSPEDALGPALACASRLFAPDGEARIATSVLVLPLRARGRAFGFLLARKVDSLVPYAAALPTDADEPFLRLVASHIESALEGARLRARVSTVLGHLPSAIFVVRAGHVVSANAAARRILATPEGEPLEGRAFLDLVPVDERDSLRDIEQSVAREGSVRLLDRRLVDAKGAPRPVELTALPIAFEGAPATLVIAEDVAERMRTRTELAFAERLATVGALAAGVAHEVNNPLTYVLFHLERLAKRVPEDQRAGALAALDGATRIRDIVRDLQTFARDEGTRATPVDVHAVLDKVLSLAAPELRYRARVVRDFGAISYVQANEGRLAQVFLNLTINAAHAMDATEGGVEKNELRVTTRMDGDRVAIDVSDTGAGIAPQDLSRIFEPFFSTKQSSGSGLGLSICRNLVEALGGAIEVTSALGRGTRFTVLLPPATAAPVAVEPYPARETHRRRVLLVDDDPRLLSVVGDVLSENHDVARALGGVAALHRLERDPFDAIVCDLMMPDVSGMDVHAWLALHRPELARRVVFLTGGAVTPESQAFVSHVDAPVLAKPVSQKDLLDAIDRLATGTGSPDPSV